MELRDLRVHGYQSWESTQPRLATSRATRREKPFGDGIIAGQIIHADKLPRIYVYF